MHILPVCGFLGAGKTTLIRHLVGQLTDIRCVILENEMATANVDAQLLRSASANDAERIPIWEMTEGCACCTTSDSLPTSVLTIANTINPDLLIIEPSGVAQVGRIISLLQTVQYEQIQLLAPVVLVDGLAFERTRTIYETLLIDAGCNAGTILATKQPTGEQLASIRDYFTHVGGKAPVLLYNPAEESSMLFNRLLTTPYGESQPLLFSPPPDLDSLSLLPTRPLPLAHLLNMLDGIMVGAFGDIPRAKGVLSVSGSMLEFQLVDRRYEVRPFEGVGASMAVFIGRNLRKEALQALFA